jgi:nucleoside phosphorylase
MDVYSLKADENMNVDYKTFEETAIDNSISILKKMLCSL